MNVTKLLGHVLVGACMLFITCLLGGGGGIIWSPADFVHLPPDKEIISL